MEIIRNNRGGLKVFFEGYMYTKRSSNRVSIRWQCSNRVAFCCQAWLKTTWAMKSPRLQCNHSHPPDPLAVEEAKYREQRKQAKQAKQAAISKVAERSAKVETALRSSRFILCDGQKLAELAPGEGQGFEGKIVHMTPSHYILCARKKLAQQAPGERQLSNSKGSKGEGPDVRKPVNNSRRSTNDIGDMISLCFPTTSQKGFAKPSTEVTELDITAKSRIGSEKTDITQSVGGLTDEEMTPPATPRRDIKRGYISTDRNRNFRVMTVSSSVSPVNKTFTASAKGMVQSPETPKGELRTEMTDMTPSVFISHATTEAAKSVTEEIEKQGTSKDYLRNEKVDMMPSIYILSAQKKAAEMIDLSETSSRTEEEEEEIRLPESHKGRNGDDGSEDGHRADVLTEETSSDDDQFRLGTKLGRASTVFDSPSVDRRSVGNLPTIVIVDTPNGEILSESETGSNGEPSIAVMILNPVKVDICRDEVKEYLYRQFAGVKNPLVFCSPKRVHGKSFLQLVQNSKIKQRSRLIVHQKPVRPEPVYVSPSEAAACLSRKPGGGTRPPFRRSAQFKNVEKAKKNLPQAKEIGIQNISSTMDSGHFTKTIPKVHKKICKRTNPSENLDMEQEPVPGKNDRKRRKVTPEENFGTQEPGEEIDGWDKAELVDEEQVYIDEDWTEVCQEDDDEFVYKEVLEQNIVKEEVDQIVNKEVMEQNIVKEEVDQIVVNKELTEQSIVKEEVDQILVDKELPEQNVIKKEQTMVNNECKNRGVNKEQNVVRVHKWVVNFLPDGEFVLQEVDEEQIMTDVDNMISHKTLAKQSVGKDEIDQTVVNKHDEFVELGKVKKQSLEQKDGKQSVVQKKDKGHCEDEEQNVIQEESQNMFLVMHEVEKSDAVKETAEQSLVHREEDWVVVLQEEEQLTRERGDEDKCILQGEDKEQLLVKGEREQIVKDEWIVTRGSVEQSVYNKEVQDQSAVKKAEHIVIQEEQEDCVVVDEEVEEQIVVKGRVEQIVILETVDGCIVIEQEGEPSMAREEVQQNGIILIDE